MYLNILLARHAASQVLRSTPLTPRHHPPDPLSPQSVPSSPSSCVQLPGDVSPISLFSSPGWNNLRSRYLSAKKKKIFLLVIFLDRATKFLLAPWWDPPTENWTANAVIGCRSSTPPNAELRILSKIEMMMQKSSFKFILGGGFKCFLLLPFPAWFNHQLVSIRDCLGPLCFFGDKKIPPRERERSIFPVAEGSLRSCFGSIFQSLGERVGNIFAAAPLHTLQDVNSWGVGWTFDSKLMKDLQDLLLL